MTTTLLSTKIKELRKKIQVAKSLVKKTDYDATILDNEKKNCTTYDFNKLTKRKILNAKKKGKELADKPDISNPINNSNLNTKLVPLATKAESRAK